MAAAFDLVEPSGPLASEEPQSIRILGPTFSGSARSLAVALLAFPGQPDRALPPVSIRSGTATDGGLAALFVDLLQGSKVRLESYASLATPSEDLQRCVWNRLVPERLGLDTGWIATADRRERDDDCKADQSLWRQRGDRLVPPDNGRVALLVESSAYGRQFERNGFTVVPFPPNIGAVRDAYREIGNAAKHDGQKSSSSVPAPLPYDAAAAALQGLPAFGLEVTLSSQDLVLDNALRRLSRRRFQVVGIVATSTADKLVLAEKVRTYVPDARIVTFEGDVFLSHPRFYPATAGMLVASTNPLIDPFPAATAERSGELNLLFDLDGAQGIFRAVRELVGGTAQESSRFVVASVVAKHDLVLLHRYDVTKDARAARLARASTSSAERPAGRLVLAGILGGGFPAGREGAIRLPVLWSLSLWLASLLLGFVAAIVAHDLRAGRALLGLVPLDLVAPQRWRRPEGRDRVLHALVVLFPLTIGLLYFVLAIPAFSAGLAADRLPDGLAAALGYVALGCTSALGMAVFYLLSGLAWRTGHDLTSTRFRRSSQDESVLFGGLRILGELRILGPLFVVLACTTFAVFAGRLAIQQFLLGDGEAGTLLVSRTLSLSGGVSPLVPTLLMTLVLLGWALLALQSREVLHRLSPRHDVPSGSDCSDERLRVLCHRYQRLWAAVDPLGSGRSNYRWWGLLVAVPALYLSLLYGQSSPAPLLRSIEGRWFDWGATILFFANLLLVVAVGVSLVEGWRALREFAASAGALVDLTPLDGARRPPVTQPLRQALASLRARQPRSTAALRQRVERGCGLGTLWLEVILWLNCRDSEAKTRQAAKVAAQTYASQGAGFLARHAFRQLRYLMVFLTISLVALFFAVVSYPFEPRRVVLTYLGALLVLAAVLSVTIVVQAGREQLLVKLAGVAETAGGWRPLTQRLSFFAGLPALSLLAGRFPELRQLLSDWIEPFFNALR